MEELSPKGLNLVVVVAGDEVRRGSKIHYRADDVLRRSILFHRRVRGQALQ